MHGVLSGFTSVDNLAEKFPFISGYAYSLWSPIVLVDKDGNQPRIQRRGNYYRPRTYNNNYAMFHNGVQPSSTRTTTRYQRAASMTPISNDNISYTRNIRTAGNNEVQTTNGTSRGRIWTAITEAADNAIINFEFVKMVIYKPDGRVENKTEIRLLDFKDQMMQNQWETDFQKLTQELGEMPLLNPFEEGSVKKFNDYQQTIRDRIGISPKQEIMQEYMQNPEKFIKVDSKTEIIPEFRQGQ
jgi:hypothetical protein